MKTISFRFWSKAGENWAKECLRIQAPDLPIASITFVVLGSHSVTMSEVAGSIEAETTTGSKPSENWTINISLSCIELYLRRVEQYAELLLLYNSWLKLQGGLSRVSTTLTSCNEALECIQSAFIRQTNHTFRLLIKIR